jgi:hypothetical protein
MKTKLLYLFILLSIYLKFNAQGSWSFAAPSDGSGSAGPESARSICTDANGNTYVVGNFNGSGVATDFDLSSSSTNISIATSVDGFIASYDKNGNFRWKTIISGTSSDFGAPAGGVCTNGTHVWISGSANVSVGAAQIISSTNTISISSTGTGNDVLVAKLNCSNGSVQWAQGFGGTGVNDIGQGICVDPSGNAYVVGAYSSAFTLGSINAPAPGGASDFFIAKFNSTGTMIAFNSGGSTTSNDMIANGGGICYVPAAIPALVVTGHTSGSTANFGTFTGLGNFGLNDALLLELDLNLNFTNALVMGSTAADELLGAVYDPLSGDVFVSGYCSGNITFPGTAALSGLGGVDITLARYSISSNNFVWASIFGGTGNERGWSLAADGYGGILLSGFTASAPCNFNNSISIPTNAGLSDVFVTRFNASGTAAWVLTAGGTGSEEARSIASYVETSPSYSQSIFVAGITTGANCPFGSTTVGNDGGSDFFLAKINDATISCQTPTLTLTGNTNVLCNGGNTGAATVSATGGSSFTYTWSPNGGNSAIASGLSAGTYTCATTNNCGSSSSRTVSITQPTAISVTALSQTNISCNGGSNGAASINIPTGGAGGYTYNWTPGNPSGDGTTSVTGLTAGTWTCTVTDANSCTRTQTFNVTQPTSISLTQLSQTNISCNGGTNGAASVNAASGGEGGFTYNWTPGNPTGDGTTSVTGLAAGTWSCTVTDANSCTRTQTFNVTQPTSISLTQLSQINISCNGGTNGAASVNAASGGEGGFTYNWTPGNPTGDGTTSVTGLAAGTWSCTVTDANSCTRTQTFNVTQPTAISVTALSQINISCNGGTNGAASVNAASGGEGGFTYNWTPGNPTGDGTTSVTGLTAGTWTCTVTDLNSCTASQTFNITQPTVISLTSLSQTNISCNGGSNGAASVNAASGGAGGFTYNWTPGNPTGDGTTSVTGLTAGTWSCTVTDVNSCTRTQTFNITQPATPVSASNVVTNVLCFGGATGAINLTPAGGTTPYSFIWGGGITTEDRTGLLAGTYNCTVTDNNGCTTTSNATITQPATAVSASNVVTNVLCFGASTGAINLTPAGGTTPYTFNWGGGITTDDRTGLLAGAYTCTITDANGCTTTSNATITQPATAVSASNVVTNILCFGASTGAINLTPAGGTTPYTFNWGGGITTDDRTGLLAGTYNCTVTDNNGCTTTSNATVTQPASAIAATISSTNTACLSNTGIASVITSGGTPSYSYTWSPSGGTASIATGLGAGTYSCVITDANSCSITKTVSVNTASGPSLTFLAQTNISCFGGSNGAASVNAATGGSAPYTYNWTPGNPTGDGTTSVTGLTAQVYTCTVTDANGCSAFQTFNITQPASALATSTAVTNVLCFGNPTGAGTVTTSGGTSPYTYLWSGAQTTSVITGQTSGVRTVTVTDANGCTSVKSVNISQPASALATSTAVTNVLCNGNTTGAATITVTGGTASYSYLWSTGATTSVIISQASGTKSYTITDANGCNATGNVIISQPTSALVTATAVTNILCNGNATGSATITASGGTAAYSYLWSTGSTTSVITSQTAGVKTATVTDANGCTSIKSVSISQPASALATSTAVTNVACFGNSTGSATITATGGTTSYSYLWSTGATTSVITFQSAGTKTYTVTDANGCTSSGNAIISQPSSALATSTAVSNVLCNSGSTGSATITATGGTSAYSYLWSTGATTSVITSQTAGVKTATVTDANGCTSVNSVSILEPTVLTATTSQTNTTCNGVCDGSAIVTPNGGTAPYTFVWSPVGLTSSSINSLCAGSYTVLVTDANGCSLTKTITITEPTAVTISAVSGNILCNGGSTSVTVTANGGTGAYTGTGSFTQTAGTYTYTVTDANACSTNTVITITEPTALNISLSAAPIACNGSTTQVTFNMTGGTAPYSGNSPVTVSAGSYTYIVTDANNCTVSETITVNQPAAIVASQTITLCNGQSLSIGSNTYTSSGTYVDVLQAQVNGCDSTLTTELTILPAITHTQNVALCFGEVLSVGSNIYNASGTYTDVLTASNGCDSTLTTVLVINPAIDVNTSLSGLTISANESSASYQWIDCDNSNQPIVGETNQSFTASSNGNYAVIVTQNNCSDTSACVNISTVGIKDASKSNTVNIYPNPSNGIYNMTGLIINSKITVYDAIGQIVYTSTTTESKETIDISNLPNGVYMIQLNSENGTTTKKVIKKD